PISLGNVSVDSWAGLDPIMAGAEDETEVLHRDVDLNTDSFVNATEAVIEDSPEVAQTVVDTYERARAWALEHPEETAQLLAGEADTDLDVAGTVTQKRSGFDVSPVPGEQQTQVLANIAPIFVTSGDVDSQDEVDEALETLFAPEFLEQAESAD